MHKIDRSEVDDQSLDPGGRAAALRPAPSSGRGGRHRDSRSHRRWRRQARTVSALMVVATALGSYILWAALANANDDPSPTTTPVSQRTGGISIPLQNTPGVRVFILSATEDGTVDASNPGAVAGNNKVLWVDAEPQVVSYLKFRVDDVDDGVTRAVLMMYATTGSPDGFSVYLVPDVAWDEATITYETAPTLGALLGAAGSFGEGSVVEVELDPFIFDLGDYALALVTDASTRMGFGSTESDVVGPQLLILTDNQP